MTFNEKAFKKRWRALCAAGNINPVEGVQGSLSIYQRCNIAAVQNGLAAAQRTFEHRCDHPDDGKFHFEDDSLRPMEAPPQIEIWDIIGMEMVREAWRDAREEATLAKIHDVQEEREAERLA